jgi:Phage integrase, N-terminal SAM-like domain
VLFGVMLCGFFRMVSGVQMVTMRNVGMMPGLFMAPAGVVFGRRAGPSTKKKFFEFFTVPIRTAHTRAAYYRTIQQFLAWSERAGYQQLEDIEPITVAAYIETLQRRAAPPTVKQHMAAIRMLFSWKCCNFGGVT